jgi:hypothetical protein
MRRKWHMNMDTKYVFTYLDISVFYLCIYISDGDNILL